MYETKREKLFRLLKERVRELKGKEFNKDYFVANLVIETGQKESDILEALETFKRANELYIKEDKIIF